jgi:hypothetical protein
MRVDPSQIGLDQELGHDPGPGRGYRQTFENPRDRGPESGRGNEERGVRQGCRPRS